MKNGNDANGHWSNSDRCPYTVVGSGRLNSFIYKIGGHGNGWSYHFNVFRCCPETGQVDQRFKPEDLLHMTTLVRLLAREIAKDGCVEAGLRDDLGCLATFLDVLAAEDVNLRFLSMDDDVAAAIHTVLGYLWDDEQLSYKQNPSKDHIFTSLQVVNEWFRGESAPSKFPSMTESRSSNLVS